MVTWITLESLILAPEMKRAERRHASRRSGVGRWSWEARGSSRHESLVGPAFEDVENLRLVGGAEGGDPDAVVAVRDYETVGVDRVAELDRARGHRVVLAVEEQEAAPLARHPAGEVVHGRRVVDRRHAVGEQPRLEGDGPGPEQVGEVLGRQRRVAELRPGLVVVGLEEVEVAVRGGGETDEGVQRLEQRLVAVGDLRKVGAGRPAEELPEAERQLEHHRLEGTLGTADAGEGKRAGARRGGHEVEHCLSPRQRLVLESEQPLPAGGVADAREEVEVALVRGAERDRCRVRHGSVDVAGVVAAVADRGQAPLAVAGGDPAAGEDRPQDRSDAVEVGGGLGDGEQAPLRGTGVEPAKKRCSTLSWFASR